MYQILFDNKRVRKKLEKLPKKEQERITQAIEDHLIDFGPHTQGIKFVKMTGEYRLRQGDYRILFSVEKDTIKIKNTKNRKDVYR